MEKKISKKIKKTGEKENCGGKNSKKVYRRHAALMLSGIVMGMVFGVSGSILYFERRAEVSLSRGQSGGKQAESGSEVFADQGGATPLIPTATSSSAIHTFSGTVAKTEGKKVYIDYFSCGKGNKTYAVSVTKDTRIVKRENQQENTANFSDIKAGDNIAVTTAEDINKKSNLTAREIKIMGKLNVSFSDDNSQK